MYIHDVSDYTNLLVRLAHIICNRPLYRNTGHCETFISRSVTLSRVIFELKEHTLPVSNAGVF
jgi:hypothetical protein